MNTDTESETARWTDKISKLLLQAERAGTPEEAETFTAAAARLQAKRSIDQTMIDAHRGSLAVVKDVLIERKITCEGSMSVGWQQIANAVCRAHDFKLLVQIGYKSTRYSFWHGWKSEIEAAELLYTSLLIQAESAAKVYMKARKIDYPWESSYDRQKAKRSFLAGFASAVERRITRARREAERDYNADELERRFNDLRTNEEADAFDVERVTESIQEETGLVLANREDQQNAWFAEVYGTSFRESRGSSFGGTGYYGGVEAGGKASIGTGRAISGTRVAIGAGS